MTPKKSAQKQSWEHVSGTLVALRPRGADDHLDGFWSHGPHRRPLLNVFLHGMGGNFYHSRFKREILAQAQRHGFDALSFHNRGYGGLVRDERFGHCLADLDAVIAFAQREGYRGCVLTGHSTGCQKAIYYQARRRSPFVRGIALAAPADDAALARRELGRRYAHCVRHARSLVKQGRGDTPMPEGCQGFTARRWLSASHTAHLEARILDYEGPMNHFASLTLPVVAFFGTDEEFAVLSVDDMGARLRARAGTDVFHFYTVPGGNHGFRGCEVRAVRRMYRWLEREVTP